MSDSETPKANPASAVESHVDFVVKNAAGVDDVVRASADAMEKGQADADKAAEIRKQIQEGTAPAEAANKASVLEQRSGVFGDMSRNLGQKATEQLDASSPKPTPPDELTPGSPLKAEGSVAEQLLAAQKAQAEAAVPPPAAQPPAEAPRGIINMIKGLFGK